MKWYIKERINPQIGTYYKAEGKLTKKDAKKKEDSLYGWNIMHPYDSEEEYNNAIKFLQDQGEKIS